MLPVLIHRMKIATVKKRWEKRTILEVSQLAERKKTFMNKINCHQEIFRMQIVRPLVNRKNSSKAYSKSITSIVSNKRFFLTLSLILKIVF